MKTAAIVIAIAFLAGASAEGKAKTGREVTVYFVDNAGVPYIIKTGAQAVADKMFDKIGVSVNWKSGRASSDRQLDRDSIVIEFVDNTPSAFHSEALAYALPYEGTHVRIFWDRVRTSSWRRELLAHVMVHEMTHILQGVARHSDEGIMKASWSNQEKAAMQTRPLGFTPHDVELIYLGMDSRRN